MGLVISQRFGGPAFSAGQNAVTSLVTGVATKVIFGVKDFDTDSCFASSRFTPTTPGYYQLNSTITWTPGSTSSNFISIFKNGAEYQRGSRSIENANNLGSTISSLVFFNGTTDYAEIFAFTNGGTVNTNGAAVDCWFNGEFVRGL